MNLGNAACEVDSMHSEWFEIKFQSGCSCRLRRFGQSPRLYLKHLRKRQPNCVNRLQQVLPMSQHFRHSF